MIFVTLGTQDKPFNRLLDAVQKQIDNKKIKEKVIVQAGCTKYESEDMEVLGLIPMEDFEKNISDCKILITHGGVGSIVDALKRDKIVIAAARLAKYGEHVNDHQLQIIKNFGDAGYIIPLDDFDKLDEALKKAKKFKPNKYKSNTKKMIKLVEELINK